MVSVIIPCYKPQYLTLYNTLNSIKNQTHDNIEIIICGDHNSREEQKLIFRLLTKFNELNIQYTENNTIPGISATRNQAVSAANGEWIVWLDADDTLEPNCIEELHKCVANKSLNYVIGKCNVHTVNSSKLKLSSYFFELYKKYKATEFDPFMLTIMAIQPQIIKKDIFMNLNGFSLDYPKAELTEFMLRYLTNYPSTTISFSCNAIYNYKKDTPNSVSKNRIALFNYRRKALLSYASNNHIEVDDIVYYGRDLNLDVQLYLPIRNGIILSPPYRENIKIDETEKRNLLNIKDD